jgi:hypothetical protein
VQGRNLVLQDAESSIFYILLSQPVNFLYLVWVIMQATSEEDRQNWINAIQGVILALINTSSAFAHVYNNYIVLEW